MTSHNSQYVDFQTRRTELLSLLQECREAMAQIDMASWSQTVEELHRRLGNERFKVLVLGEFKRGKSTFINALLGREVLPAFPTPCTAIINELKWGAEPSAVLHFKPELPAELPASLDEAAARHIALHRGEQIPPLTISADELERFVVIPESDFEEKRGLVETPYDRAEIYWPLDILRESVEIIDSPGLNEMGSRTKITLDYLGNVDAVLFVFSVHALASQSEVSVIDRDLRSAGHTDLFFICNRFDELRRETDRDKVVNYAYEQLAHRTEFGREGIFFVSALDAVIGREENNPALIDKSSLPRLESRLAEFLVYDRGRIKLLQPARQLNSALKVALRETIPQQKRMLDSSRAELQQRYDAARPKLDEAVNQKLAAIRQLERAAARMKDAVAQAASLHLLGVADQLPVWAAQAENERQVNMLKVFSLDDQLKAVAAEIVACLTTRMEQETANWQETQLRPIMANQLAEFVEVAESRVEQFLEALEGIRFELTGIEQADFLGGQRVGATERILSGLGGLVIGGAGAAIEGATGGYEGMLRSLIPQVALAAGAIWVLHLNPITVVPALIGLGVFRSLRKGDALTDKVKQEVGLQMARMLASNLPQIAGQMADVLKTQADAQIEAIGEHLDREIDSIRQQVESVLRAKEAGDEDVSAQINRLNSVESQLQSIDARLDDFTLSLVSPNSRNVFL